MSRLKHNRPLRCRGRGFAVEGSWLFVLPQPLWTTSPTRSRSRCKKGSQPVMRSAWLEVRSHPPCHAIATC